MFCFKFNEIPIRNCQLFYRKLTKSRFVIFYPFVRYVIHSLLIFWLFKKTNRYSMSLYYTPIHRYYNKYLSKIYSDFVFKQLIGIPKKCIGHCRYRLFKIWSEVINQFSRNSNLLWMVCFSQQTLQYEIDCYFCILLLRISQRSKIWLFTHSAHRMVPKMIPLYRVL